MSHFQKRLALLKNPPFFLYVVGFFFAAIGNGLGYIAVSWIVVTRHGGVAPIAILMACFWGPNVLLGPLMGVLADRLPRKWLIFASHFVRAIIYIFFSIYLRDHFVVTDVYWMMLCSGIAFTAFYSTAFSFMRELVSADDLANANTTVDVMYEIGNFIGMGGAGFLIAFTSDEMAIFLNGISFVIACVCLLLVPQTALRHGVKQVAQKIRLIADFREGLRYLQERKKLLSIYTIQLLILITFLTTPLLLVPFSKTILHATVTQFGIIEAFASTGIVLGGIAMPWIAEKYGLFRTLLLFSILLCVNFLYFGYNRSIPIATALYFVIGFCGAIWPLIISRAQSLTEHDFQGRVQSTFNSISGSMMLLFYFSVGSIGEYLGVSKLYLLEVLITALAIFFLVQTRRDF